MISNQLPQPSYSRETITPLPFFDGTTPSQWQKLWQRPDVSREEIYHQALVLSKQYFKMEASDLFLEYQPLWPTDLAWLRDTITFCLVTGRVFRGEQLITQWHRLTDLHHPQETVIKRCAEFYRQQWFTEIEVQQLLATGLSAMRQFLKTPPQSSSLVIGYANYDGFPYLYYTIQTDLSVDEVVDLDELHNQLLVAGKFKHSLLDGIIITFEPYPTVADPVQEQREAVIDG
jgi:hypothetical protein